MGKCRIRQQSDIKSHRQREGEREEGERLLSKRSRGDETRQQPSCIVLARVVRIDRSMHSALLMMMTMSHRPLSPYLLHCHPTYYYVAYSNQFG